MASKFWEAVTRQAGHFLSRDVPGQDEDVNESEEVEQDDGEEDQRGERALELSELQERR